MVAAAIQAKIAMPPTTPPTIAPMLDFELGCGEGIVIMIGVDRPPPVVYVELDSTDVENVDDVVLVEAVDCVLDTTSV